MNKLHEASLNNISDGLSQSSRIKKELIPEYISLDDRVSDDFIKITAEFSKKNPYFNEDNIHTGDWSKFIDLTDQEIQKLVKNIDEAHSSDEVDIKLNQPHIVLFLCFLKLLKYPQKQINNLTQRHLDYYFREILKFKEKPGHPDKVYLQFNLSSDVSKHLIKEGTKLEANKDEFGNICHYEVQQDTVLNNARLTSVKTLLFNNKQNKGYLNTYSIVDKTNNILEVDSFNFSGLVNSQPSLDERFFGLLISSPALFLEEGERTVTLECLVSTTLAIAESINTELPLDFYYSSGNDWVKIEDVFIDYTLNTLENKWKDMVKGIMKFTFKLKENAPSFIPINQNIDKSKNEQQPMLKIILSSNANYSHYNTLKNILIEKIKIDVAVKGIKELKIRNDSSILNNNKPFEIFSHNPQMGSSFYFTNSEISSKKLNTLKVNLDWISVPNDFNNYYMEYIKSGLSDIQEINKKCYKTTLYCYNKKIMLPIKDNQTDLFNSSMEFDNFLYEDALEINKPNSELNDDPLQNDTYYRLELTGMHFFHNMYTKVLSKVSLINAMNLMKATDTEKIISVNPPYTPLVKKITLDYTASDEIDINNVLDEKKLFYIEPFSIFPVTSEGKEDSLEIKRFSFISDFSFQGGIFLGFKDLKLLDLLSIYFEFDHRSGDPEKENPTITWSFLSSKGWEKFSSSNIILDETESFSKSGLITFLLNNNAFDQITRMPVNYVWLCASVDKNSSFIPNIVNIHTQIISAISNKISNKRVPAKTINKLVTTDPQIKSISQPYSSFGGYSLEKKSSLYQRASERLRHKNRAITKWDYEHLVLERFPSIFKVKCIKTDSGVVSIIVIADIKQIEDNFSLKPKVPYNILGNIKNYIQPLSSPFVIIVPQNPSYEEIVIRLAVRFKIGFEAGYYKEILNKEIVKQLSPWAFDKSENISFNNNVHTSKISHSLEKLSYVDYVAKVKIAKHTIINNPTKYNCDLANENVAEAFEPDGILISCEKHIIDIITTDNFEEKHFDGINYMILDTDFIIASIPQAPERVCGMVIGEDFIIKNEDN